MELRHKSYSSSKMGYCVALENNTINMYKGYQDDTPSLTVACFT